MKPIILLASLLLMTPCVFGGCKLPEKFSGRLFLYGSIRKYADFDVDFTTQTIRMNDSLSLGLVLLDFGKGMLYRNQIGKCLEVRWEIMKGFSRDVPDDGKIMLNDNKTTLNIQVDKDTCLPTNDSEFAIKADWLNVFDGKLYAPVSGQQAVPNNFTTTGCLVGFSSLWEGW